MENVLQTKKQITDLVASTISNNSSSEHYSPKFQAIEMQREKKIC